MASALTVLFLGCWLAGQSRAQGQELYPKPSISASPGGVIPVGGNVTIRCCTEHQAWKFILYKDGDGNYTNLKDAAGSVAEFPFPSARQDDGGSYTCRYSNRKGGFSAPSAPVQIRVAEETDRNGDKQPDPPMPPPQGAEGPRPKPSISGSPRGVIPVKGNITIWCWTEQLGMRFLLYKDGDGNQQTYTDPAGSEAEFTIIRLSREDGGNYTCRYSNRAGPAPYSAPSDPVQIMVLEGPLPKPSISASPRGVIPVKGNVTIWCWTEQRGWRFLLYKDGDGNHQTYTDPAGSEAEFTIIRLSREDGGNYTCRYSNRAGPAPYSAPSDPVQIMVLDAGSTSAEGTDPTLLETPSTLSPSAIDAGSTPTRGTHPTLLDTLSTPSPSATHAGSTPSRGTNQSLLGTTSTPSPSPKDAGSIPTRGTHPTTLETTAAQTQPGELGSDLSGAIVAGVIVGATGLLLLLLLLGFHHRRRTRAREGPALKQSRESEAATTVYSLAGLGKQQDVPKPDPGAEGLTYTELDRQALQAKRDAQVPAPEPVLYATVSGSQGAPQLTP